MNTMGRRMISIIIPLRLSLDRIYDEIGRIDRILRTIPQDLFDVLIVDYGTPAARQPELERLHEAHSDLTIHRVETKGPFSIGHARDIGVQQATQPVVMFHDIDFLCSETTYRRIAAEAEERDLAQQAYDFFTVPTVFLTPEGTHEYLERFGASSLPPERWVHAHALRENEEVVEHFALGSSALVINRYSYLCSGGHDRSFVGHGAEDFELYHRLAARAPIFPRPAAYYENITAYFGNYRGYRAYFALFGAEVWMRGILMVHLAHPRRENADRSYRRSRRNFQLLQDRMRDFDRTQYQPDPLTDPNVKEKTLLLMQPGSQPARAFRMLIPALGECEMMRETDFATTSRLLDFVRRRDFTQVVTLTPFANEQRLQQYRALQSAGIRTYTFDRGALPDSWFLDDGGFLAESSHYAPASWDVPLTTEQQREVDAWLESYLDNPRTLENNGPVRGEEYWRRKLGLGSKKVLFVALQRPSDVATTRFAGPVGSAEGFSAWLTALAARIDSVEYAIIAKVHPLEPDHEDIEGVMRVPGDANIYDLLELAEKTIVINSGVGLLSMLHGTPTIACGECFYAHPGLAESASSPDELYELVAQPSSLRMEKVQRFLHYLVFRFYSFGESHYSEIKGDDGECRRIVNKIHFRRVLVPGRYCVDLGLPLEKVNQNSYLVLSAGRNRTTGHKSTMIQNGNDAMDGWPGWKLDLYRLYCLVTTPMQSAHSRKKMKQNPIGFLAGAKNPVNRLAGRWFLERSQRRY